MMVQRLGGAQKSLTKLLAGSIYDAPGGSSNRLTGLRACCNESAGVAYGDIEEEDLVATDGTYPWEGKMDSTAEAISTGVIRDLATEAKIRDGANGKPNLVTMPETLWNVLADELMLHQRFVESKATVDAGFTGIRFEGKDIVPDDYCPSGYCFAINESHYGFAVHKQGLFMRSKWAVIPGSPEDKTLKIYFDGEAVCNNRKAHKGHSGLTV